MKILLIQPPIQDFYQTAIRTQPIGLAYLAASLKSNGYEVEILDCQTEKRKTIPLPPELSYLRDYYPSPNLSPFKLYTHYYHFGLEWKEIQEKVKNSGADIFGISSLFTPYQEEALKVARIIKEWDKRKIVVFGGANVSPNPAKILQHPEVDYVVIGEGEIRFPLLLEEIKKGITRQVKMIDGIGYRKNGEIQINPIQSFISPLDQLPYPARELLELGRYCIQKKPATMIITSRGCPQGCSYCSTYLGMGKSFRARSPENIIGEIKECRKRYQIEVFDIEDDNFTFDQQRAKHLLQLIIKTFGEKALEFSAMNGISFASLDSELLNLLQKAGFRTLNLSLVSTKPSIQKKMARPSGLSEFDFVLNAAEQYGLNVVAYAIFGMPGQTRKEMVDTLIYLMGKRVLIGPSIYYPTPGTSLFEICRKAGILPPYSNQWRSTAFPIETEEFNRLDLVTILRLTRVINFVKKKMEEKEIEEGITGRELWNSLKLRKKMGKDNLFTWVNLLFLLFQEKAFFRLQPVSNGKMELVKEKSSPKVLDYFLEKIQRKKILPSKNNLDK